MEIIRERNGRSEETRLTNISGPIRSISGSLFRSLCSIQAAGGGNKKNNERKSECEDESKKMEMLIVIRRELRVCGKRRERKKERKKERKIIRKTK